MITFQLPGILFLVTLQISFISTCQARLVRHGIERNSNKNTTFLEKIALTVPPVARNNEILIPSHKMVATDFYGSCSFGDACDDFQKGICDSHVLNALLTSLDGKCSPTSTKRVPTVDLGSNVGQFSFYLRAMGCEVTSVEPQEPLHLFFKASLAVNGWDDGSVKLLEGGVGDEPGVIHIPKLWVPGGHHTNRWKQNVDTVVVPLRDIITQDIAFMKVDIDGPEALVFRALLPILEVYEVPNIEAEITFSWWPKFNISYEEGHHILDQLYDYEYSVYLIARSVFHEYPSETMDKLHFLKDFHYFPECYHVPRELLYEVLMMNSVSTKDLFFSTEFRPGLRF